MHLCVCVRVFLCACCYQKGKQRSVHNRRQFVCVCVCACVCVCVCVCSNKDVSQATPRH